MKIYKSKYNQISSGSHAEVFRIARYEYHKIQKRTPRRQPYVKSKYFRNDKVFINQYWDHLKQKRVGDQMRRTRLFICAIDLIRQSVTAPDTIYRKDDQHVELHRFYGKTKDGLEFCVQIRENKRSKRKDFMSVYPVYKTK